MAEIQSMEDSKFFSLATSKILDVQLRASPQERSDMKASYTRFVEQLDPDVAPNFQEAARLSNYDLYCTLRMNDIEGFKPQAIAVLRLDQAHALSPAQVLHLAEEKSKIYLDIDDDTRDTLIQSRQAWIETMDDDIGDAFDADMDTYSNWDLYAEHRVNGFPLLERENQLQMSARRSQTRSM
jgi:hypothetical protein